MGRRNLPYDQTQQHQHYWGPQQHRHCEDIRTHRFQRHLDCLETYASTIISHQKLYAFSKLYRRAPGGSSLMRETSACIHQVCTLRIEGCAEERIVIFGLYQERRNEDRDDNELVHCLTLETIFLPLHEHEQLS